MGSCQTLGLTEESQVLSWPLGVLRGLLGHMGHVGAVTGTSGGMGPVGAGTITRFQSLGGDRHPQITCQPAMALTCLYAQGILEFCKAPGGGHPRDPRPLWLGYRMVEGKLGVPA